MSVQDRLARPLPDMWDWEPVAWGEWVTPPPSTLVLHLPVEFTACDQCGAIGEILLSFGKRPARHDLDETYPTKNLHAFRCADCGHDTVHDKRTGEHWDLDESDYGPAGSVRPEHAHTTDLSEPEEPTTLF